jgi:hypothetical protein
MVDRYSMSENCAANWCSLAKCFACLKDVANHPFLKEDEKFLWLWLFANQSTNYSPFTCSMSYEQLAMALDKSVEDIHRLLRRLRIMGGLIANTPIDYGKPTTEMIKKVYNLTLTLPPNPLHIEEFVNAD